jgi:hypothetical protein
MVGQNEYKENHFEAVWTAIDFKGTNQEHYNGGWRLHLSSLVMAGNPDEKLLASTP